jgi:uncharacterized membrane protein HdeD (DUF308 family)
MQTNTKRSFKEFLSNLSTYRGVKKFIGTALMVWGVFALFTPFTPGAVLFFVGFIMLYGKDEAARITKKWVGEKWYTKWNLEKFFEEKKKVTDI